MLGNKRIEDKIILGDSRAVLANSKLFKDSSVDFVITSPPYADKRKNSYESIHPDKYVDWFMPIAKEIHRILKNDGSFVLNIKEHARNGEREIYVLELILEMKKQGWLWVEEYCWYKKNSFPGKWPNRFRDAWERCLHFTKNKDFVMYQDAVKVPMGEWSKKRFKSMTEKDFQRHMSQTNGSLGRNLSSWLDRREAYPHNVMVFEEEHYVSNVLELATVCYNKNHGAAFPLELPIWFISLFTKQGDLVLDPFMGSGTTAIACIGMNRKYAGIEVMEGYVKGAERTIRALKKKAPLAMQTNNYGNLCADSKVCKKKKTVTI